MNTAIGILFKENIAGWVKTRGFVLILLAALLPVGLTAAWVGTHQGDIAVTAIEWTPEGPRVGDTVNITVTVANVFPRDTPDFNMTVRVGFYEPVPGEPQELRFRGVFNERVLVPGLEAEGREQVSVAWNPGTSDIGTFFIEAIADPDEELRETQTVNNYRRAQIQVHPPPVTTSAAEPTPEENGNATAEENGNGEPPPGNQNGNETGLPLVDVTIERVDHPSSIFVGEDVNLTAVVSNAGPEDLTGGSLILLVERERLTGSFADDRITEVRAEWVEVRTVTRALDIAAGDEIEEEMTFTANNVGRYRVQASIDLGGVAQDDDPAGHEYVQFLEADRRDVFQEPEVGVTAHGFYRGLVLDLIHLKLLVPLIALFFAAGVLEDERRRNSLPYLLTRPVPRWSLPVIRFAVSFVVAGAAITIGVLAVNALLLGQPGADAQFLYWPLGLTLGALFVYGAVFTLLGVLTARPYLWGLLYVLGFEFLIYFGRYVLRFNERPMFQAWAEFLSLNHWFLQVFSAWDPTRVQGPWFETAQNSSLLAGLGLAVIGIGAIVAAGMVMQRRDFEV